jgi:hypothetical protein
MAHAVAIGLVVALGTLAGAAFRWGRRLLVAFGSWILSIRDEAKARTKSTHPRHPLLIQSGDRRQTYLFQSGPPGQPRTYDVYAHIHVTNLDSRGIQISKAVLKYRRNWLIRAKREGDVTLTDPLAPPSYANCLVLPSQQIIHGRCHWRLSPTDLDLPEPEPLKARVSLLDQFGKESWSEWLSIRWVNDQRRNM